MFIADALFFLTVLSYLLKEDVVELYLYVHMVIFWQEKRSIFSAFSGYYWCKLRRLTTKHIIPQRLPLYLTVLNVLFVFLLS